MLYMKRNCLTGFRCSEGAGYVSVIALVLQGADQPDAVIPAIGLCLKMPTSVRSGENVAAYNANGCSGHDVLRMMLAGLDTAVSYN
jgi:hypothetical protein